MRFDAYVASDFMWRRCRAAPAGSRCSTASAASTGSTRPTTRCATWHRLFFVNERRLRNFIAAGAIDAGSPAIRLVGMPKVDCLVNGTWTASRAARLPRPRSGAPDRALRADLVAGLVAERHGRRARPAACPAPVNLIVKLHDRSRDLRERYSGGVDWVAGLAPLWFRAGA